MNFLAPELLLGLILVPIAIGFYLWAQRRRSKYAVRFTNLALLAFLTNYNDFLWPVYVLFSPESQTLPAGLSTLAAAPVGGGRATPVHGGRRTQPVPLQLALVRRFPDRGAATGPQPSCRPGRRAGA